MTAFALYLNNIETIEDRRQRDFNPDDNQYFPNSNERILGRAAHHQFCRVCNASTENASCCGASFYECAGNS